MVGLQTRDWQNTKFLEVPDHFILIAIVLYEAPLATDALMRRF